METNSKTEEPKTCGTCKFFAPDEEGRGWGVCQLTELWPAIHQLTRTDMHACYQAFQKSNWQPIQPGRSSSRPAWATAGLYISIGLTAIILIVSIIFFVIPPFAIGDLLCLGPVILLGIAAIILFWRTRR